MLRNSIVKLSQAVISKRVLQIGETSTIQKLVPVASSTTYAKTKFKSFNSARLFSTMANEDQYGERKFQFQQPRADLDMVGGYAHIMKDISGIVRYLQNPKKYIKNGVMPPKGIILSGPPGTGKSFIAEAIAGHAGVPIFIVNASELIASYRGISEKNLRLLFNSAKQLNEPCVILIDEIDSIASKRSESLENSNDRSNNSLVNQLLTLLSEDHSGIVVIATTNNFNILDPAVVRPGRFDKRIEIPLPSKDDRERIIKVHLSNRKVDESVEPSILGKLSAGFSGAKLAAWINQAAINASDDGSNIITFEYLEEARATTQLGSHGYINPNIEQRRAIAKHQAGHAIVGHILHQELYMITTIETLDTRGITEFLPQEDPFLSKDRLIDSICVGLAGRAADLLFTSSQKSAKKEIAAVRKIAKELIEAEGMGGTLSGIGGYTEIEEVLQEQLHRAMHILKQNKRYYDRLVEILINENTIFRKDFLNIFTNQASTSASISSVKSDFAIGQNKKSFMAEFKLPTKKMYRDTSWVDSTDEFKNDSKINNKDTSISIKNITSLFTRQNYLNKESMSLTQEEIAKALNVNSEQIQEIRPNLGGLLIQFKPSIKDDTEIEMLSKLLKEHDIENFYWSKKLYIQENGYPEFINYVKNHNKYVVLLKK